MRLLDDSYPAAVRDDVIALTVARLSTNAVFRFAPPFIAIIARGLDVELSEIGAALAVTELCGLASPVIGRLVDRQSRRWSMLSGLLGIAAGAAVAGASTGVVMFTAGLFVVALSKIVFDVGLGAWVADHVAYEQRGRVVGIVETSWALGLLLGVSALGLIAAVASWRWSYVAGAAAVAVMALVVARRTAAPAVAEAPTAIPRRTKRSMSPDGWLAVAALFSLMAAAQCLFVTFGPWLEDEFGITTAGLVAVTFGVGLLELSASTTSAARTDRWGKERSVILGAAIMVPAGLALAVAEQLLVPGLLLLGAFIAAFEFAIVSAIPIGPTLIPGAPGRGLGTMVAFGTLGRAVMSFVATRLFESSGLTATALLGAGFAALAGLAMAGRWRLVRQVSRSSGALAGRRSSR